MRYPRRIRVGDAKLTVVEVGKLTMKVSEIVRKGTELPRGTSFDSDVEFPIYNAHIALGEASVIVDPCDYDAVCPVGHPWRPAGYVPPRPLIAQLSRMGIARADVTDVVITHFHADHCTGSTIKTDEEGYVPAFPRARYYLGAADWTSPAVQADLRSDPETINSLGVLGASKRLTLVDRQTQVAPGITIVPAPGESPGHQNRPGDVERRDALLHRRPLPRAHGRRGPEDNGRFQRP